MQFKTIDATNDQISNMSTNYTGLGYPVKGPEKSAAENLDNKSSTGYLLSPVNSFIPVTPQEVPCSKSL